MGHIESRMFDSHAFVSCYRYARFHLVCGLVFWDEGWENRELGCMRS